MALMMRFQGKFVIPSAHTQSTCLQKQRLILQDSVFVDVVLIDLYLHFKIQSHTYTKKFENNYILPFKSLESVRFFERCLLFSPKLHLFDQKHCKNGKVIVKYYYKLKWLLYK